MHLSDKEDPTYGGGFAFTPRIPGLDTSLLAYVPLDTYADLVKAVAARADQRCEFCGGAAVPARLLARWSISDDTMHLRRLICVCRRCDEAANRSDLESVTTMHLSERVGLSKRAIEHLHRKVVATESMPPPTRVTLLDLAPSQPVSA